MAPGAVIAYDVLVRVGLARFVECRQFAEIQADLARRLGIVVPTRTLSHLAQKSVAYVQIVHRESVGLLRRDMAKRGGHILHVDGTCEEGSQVLLVCLDSLSEQVTMAPQCGDRRSRLARTRGASPQTTTRVTRPRPRASPPSGRARAEPA